MTHRLISASNAQEKVFYTPAFREGDEYVVSSISTHDLKIVEQRSRLVRATPNTLLFESGDKRVFSITPQQMISGNVLLSKPLSALCVKPLHS
jgi:hypothetical protein